MDAKLAERLRDFLPSRGLNRFINEAVAEKLAALERERLEAEMREGYRAAEREAAQISADWEPVDLEGWPE